MNDGFLSFPSFTEGNDFPGLFAATVLILVLLTWTAEECILLFFFFFCDSFNGGDDFLSFTDTAENLCMGAVCLSDIYGMGNDVIAFKGPYLVLTFAVDNLMCSYGFLGRSEAQGLVRYAQYTSLFRSEDGYVCCKSGFQFQVCVRCADDNFVCNDIVGCCSFLSYLCYHTFEGVVRIGINSESYTFSFFSVAYIGFVNVGNNLHVCQVFGNGEEFRCTEAGSDSLSFFYFFSQNDAVDRRGDGCIAQIGLCTLHLLLGRSNFFL